MIEIVSKKFYIDKSIFYNNSYRNSSPLHIYGSDGIINNTDF
jgi:hypothetical protein